MRKPATTQETPPEPQEVRGAGALAREKREAAGPRPIQPSTPTPPYHAPRRRPLVNGIHALIHTQDAEAAHVLFRDVLNFPSVTAGHGWLIFALPPAELGAFIPPRRKAITASAGMCDHLEAGARERKGRRAGPSCPRRRLGIGHRHPTPRWLRTRPLPAQAPDSPSPRAALTSSTPAQRICCASSGAGLDALFAPCAQPGHGLRSKLWPNHLGCPKRRSLTPRTGPPSHCRTCASVIIAVLGE